MVLGAQRHATGAGVIMIMPRQSYDQQRQRIADALGIITKSYLEDFGHDICAIGWSHAAELERVGASLEAVANVVERSRIVLEARKRRSCPLEKGE